MNKLILGISLFFVLDANAQLKVGLAFDGGVSIHSAKSSFSDGSSIKYFTRPISYGLRAVADYKIKENIHLQSGLGITVKGMGYTYMKGSDSTYQELWKTMNQKMFYNNVYLRIPVVVNYYEPKLIDDLNMIPFGQFGIDTDINLSNSKPKGNAIDQSVNFKYHKMIDLNLVFGAGLQFKTPDGNQVQVSLVLHKALLNSTTKSYGTAQKKIILRNNQILFSLTYIFQKIEKSTEEGIF